ncbi:MAG: hypothetical protein WAL50_19235 [Kineosporiaceae bacterium]
MRDLPPELRNGPFTLDQAHHLGVSRKVADGARFRTAAPGVRVLADAPDTLLDRCRAAQLALPDLAAFSHGTAVRLGGWPTPMRVAGLDLTGAPARPTDEDALQVSVPAGTARPRFRGVRGHRVTWLPGDVVRHRGLRVTSPERTWCDLGAAGLDPLELVVLADAIRRRFERDGAARLADRLHAWGGRRGAHVLRQALASSSDRVDAPTETRLRLLFAGAGLPAPEVNRWVYDADGLRVHRPDLSWPRWRVAADYDGEHHFSWDSDDQVAAGRASNWRRRQDISRLERMGEIGWDLRLFTAYDLFRGYGAAVGRMREALREAGAPL